MVSNLCVGIAKTVAEIVYPTSMSAFTWVNAPKELIFVNEPQPASTLSSVTSSPSQAPPLFEHNYTSIQPSKNPDLSNPGGLEFIIESRPEDDKETPPFSLQSPRSASKSTSGQSQYEGSTTRSACIDDLLSYSGRRSAETPPASSAMSTCPESLTPSVRYQTGQETRNAESFALLQYFKVAFGWPWEEESASELFEKAEHFHGDCVGLLLPMLQDPKSITTGTFLACSTILRFYEEIRAPVHGRDDAQHLLGGSACVEELCRRNITLDWLSTASFWIYQRQDIAVAIINHRSPRTELKGINFVRSVGEADSYTWTKRATCLHADVIDFCFGSNWSSTHSYHALLKDLDEWDQCKPEIFSPVHFREQNPSNGRPFPDVFFTVDHYSIAMAYHLFSMVLMAVYDPTIPKIGPGASDAQKKSMVCLPYIISV
ncbi:hypothetical protein F4779DRAFT_615244 [Xylariaceae sp. FL0662B]|nr:hypothetical protein F4779DRAFT_615244 [Xylariaceae sp. FL0662B]